MLTALRTGVVIAGFSLTLAVGGCSDGSAGAADGPAGASKSAGRPESTGSLESAGRPEVTGRPESTGRPEATVVATRGPAATGATGAPAVAISLAPAVKIGTTAKIRDGVRVGIGKVRAVTVKAEQPGEVAGPAAAVAVTVRNGSDQPFSLGGMVVTVSYGQGTP